ncbi:hypothetical protein MMC07_003561 [Pseudocyphellaria aurata]|nr:hypothetical protein [Pseudocyphellaria aurata]
MASSWKPLHSNFRPHLPSLLIKYDFKNSHYKIFLTDLNYIWTEALERRQIVKRALNVDTSIDPSESTDQFHLLLRNIQKSLDGEEGTKLSMSKTEKPKQVHLHLVTQLPAPLLPLRWPVHLTLASPEVLAAELILPCLTQQSVAKSQIDSLLQQLKDKDHVISKLADRMQSDGTDFSKIFPGAIRSKVGTQLNVRESAGKMVKGLSEFDEENWRKTFSSPLGLSANISDVISKIFVPGLRETLEVNISTDHGNWWHQLKDEDDRDENASAGVLSHEAKSSNYTAMAQEKKFIDGVFQRQTTPTRMNFPITRGMEISAASDTKTSQQPQQRETDMDLESTTTNESDGDEQVWKPEVLPQDRCIRNSAVLQAESELSPRVTPVFSGADKFETDAPVHQSATNGTIASPETYLKNGLPSSKNLKSTEDVPKIKGKLGRIGGKTKPELRAEITEKSISKRPTGLDDTAMTASVVTAGQDDKTVPADIRSGAAGRVLTPIKTSVSRRETSQERANNKREQLKRQLENKSNATVKKKRKF